MESSHALTRKAYPASRRKSSRSVLLTSRRLAEPGDCRGGSVGGTLRGWRAVHRCRAVHRRRDLCMPGCAGYRRPHIDGARERGYGQAPAAQVSAAPAPAAHSYATAGASRVCSASRYSVPMVMPSGLKPRHLSATSPWQPAAHASATARPSGPGAPNGAPSEWRATSHTHHRSMGQGSAAHPAPSPGCRPQAPPVCPPAGPRAGWDSAAGRAPGEVAQSARRPGSADHPTGRRDRHAAGKGTRRSTFRWPWSRCLTPTRRPCCAVGRRGARRTKAAAAVGRPDMRRRIIESVLRRRSTSQEVKPSRPSLASTSTSSRPLRSAATPMFAFRGRRPPGPNLRRVRGGVKHAVPACHLGNEGDLLAHGQGKDGETAAGVVQRGGEQTGGSPARIIAQLRRVCEVRRRPQGGRRSTDHRTRCAGAQRAPMRQPHNGRIGIPSTLRACISATFSWEDLDG